MAEFWPLHTVDVGKNKEVEFHVEGRHDPCIAVRAAPVIEAAAALAVAGLLLSAQLTARR